MRKARGHQVEGRGEGPFSVGCLGTAARGARDHWQRQHHVEPGPRDEHPWMRSTATSDPGLPPCRG